MKKKTIRAAAIIAAIFIVICGGLFPLFKISMEKYGDYEYYKTLTAVDIAYDIVPNRFFR